MNVSCANSTVAGTVQLINSGQYLPTRNREFNFGGRYRSGERVCVPNTRHIHRAAAWSITNRRVSCALTAAWEEPREDEQGRCTGSLAKRRQRAVYLEEERSTGERNAELQRAGVASPCASVLRRRGDGVKGREDPHTRTRRGTHTERERECVQLQCSSPSKDQEATDAFTVFRCVFKFCN